MKHYPITTVVRRSSELNYQAVRPFFRQWNALFVSLGEQLPRKRSLSDVTILFFALPSFITPSGYRHDR